MSVQELLASFHEAAANPSEQMRRYLASGEKVVLCAPVYTPEELIHAMGFVPMGVWGSDTTLEKSKEYFPAFICSIVQSVLELGIRGTYDGASAIVVPSLCDSLKCLGQNWKYGVPKIPFIPMTYPQNRAGSVGQAYTRAGYARVAAELERISGVKLADDLLRNSISVYNAHNQAMRQLSEMLTTHSEITAQQRSDIFKSAFFMKKEEHTAMVQKLLLELDGNGGSGKTPVIVSGILFDQPLLLEALDDAGLYIAADDIAAQSRQYRVDAPETGDPMDALCAKFGRMNGCSVLYDAKKARTSWIVDEACRCSAKGVIVALTKFCDPEEFDYPIIKKRCEAAGIPITMIEVDRQMKSFEQAKTVFQAFHDVISW